jgi:hypothetical protein
LNRYDAMTSFAENIAMMHIPNWVAARINLDNFAAVRE